MKLMKVTDPEKVLSLIATEFKPLPSVELALEDAGGRSLAEDIYSHEDIPAFTRSTVDGYALSARNSFGASEGLPSMLDCAGEVLMGKTAPPIKDGQCLKVHTGGMIPEGADAVVMVEHTDISGSLVQIFRQVAPGENIIRRGEDLNKGVIALFSEHKLRSSEIGLLASMGISRVKVRKQPRVGFFSSGDELVDYHQTTLLPGKIRDSNAPALMYQARQLGALAEYGGILPDDENVFANRSRDLLKKVDFLVFSGGSSVGTRDFTAKTMNELGKPGLLVEGIAIQPGKPTLLANCEGKPILGLPGHPVSALNIFAFFGAAIINRLSGFEPKPYTPSVRARLSRNVPSRSGRTEYVRVKLEKSQGGFYAVPLFGRSGMLRTLAEADGLLRVPRESEGLKEGTEVDILIWF